MALRKLIIDTKSQLDAMAKDNVVVKGTGSAPEVVLAGKLAGWNYRKPIVVDNSTNANILTNYQILVTADTQSLISAGKMKSDGADIRFTDTDEMTFLNYWIETKEKITTATMTSNTTPFPNVTSADSEFSSVYAAWKAFNKTNVDAGDCWVSTVTAFPHWLKYDLGSGSGRIFTRYRLCSRNDIAANRAFPKNFTLQGTNNNIDWIILDTQTNIADPGQNVWTPYFIFPNSTSYRYHRLHITAVNDEGLVVAIGELELSDEKGINTTNTKIWVEVPSIPASGSKTIYMHYGNPDAIAISNGENTFDFFDDFLGTNLDGAKWTSQVTGNGSISIINGEVSLDTGLNGDFASIGHSQTAPYRIEARAKFGSDYIANNVQIRNRFCHHQWPFDIGVFNQNTTDSFMQVYWNGFTAIQVPMDTYLRLRQIYQPNRVDWAIFQADGTSIYSNYYTPIATPSLISYYVGDLDITNRGKIILDWVYARKYTSIEPSISSGTEEVIPYASLGTLISQPEKIDAITLGMLRWVEELLTGTDITFATRTGPIETPDESWSTWSGELSDPVSSQMTSPADVYIQFRAKLTTTDTSKTPRLYRG